MLVLVLFVVVFLMWRRTVQLRKKKGDNPLKFERTLVLDSDAIIALQTVETALKGINASVQWIDREDGSVLAKTGMTRRSWGQYLQVSVKDRLDGQCECLCESWPSFEGTLWDRGAGRLAIEALVDQLQRGHVVVLSDTKQQ